MTADNHSGQETMLPGSPKQSEKVHAFVYPPHGVFFERHQTLQNN